MVPNGSMLANTQLKLVDVPQSVTMYRYLEDKDWDSAYKIACLGVTMDDWRDFAMKAAEAMQLDYAKKAFIRIRDMRYLELLNSIDQRRSTSLGSPGKGKMAPRAAKSAAGDDEGNPADLVYKAELMAFQGQYQDAAKAFARAGSIESAINMFADLRQWEEAKVFAASSEKIDSRELVRRQAEWAEEVGDWSSAADMYVGAGDPKRAVEILGEKKPAKWADQMSSIATDMAKHSQNKQTLMMCAKHLAEAGEDAKAKAVYVKLDAVHELMELYISRMKWPEAVALADDPANAGKFDKAIFLPYAEWLALKDRFDEALAAYRRAGRPDRSVKMMEQLTFNAVVEARFKDAAYYYWLLAAEVIKPKDAVVDDEPPAAVAGAGAKKADDAIAAAESKDGKPKPRGGRRSGGGAGEAKMEEAKMAEEKSEPAPMPRPQKAKAKEVPHVPSAEDMTRHLEYTRRAEIYYAYQQIENLYQPFTSSHAEANFQVALFLINTLAGGAPEVVPYGCSVLRILYTLARNAKTLGAYKLARYAYDRLLLLVVPEREREKMELDMLTIQAKPVRDMQELLPVCFRCHSTNPLLNPFVGNLMRAAGRGAPGSSLLMSGDVCTNCSHPFIRSFVSFEVLPLVEFLPAEGVTDEEAIDLIRTPPQEASKRRLPGQHKKSGGGGGGGGADTWEADDEPAIANMQASDGSDLFTEALNRALAQQEGHTAAPGEFKTDNDGPAKGDAAGHIPIVCDAACLLTLKREEVYILRPRLEIAMQSGSSDADASEAAKKCKETSDAMGPPEKNASPPLRGVARCRYFRNMLPDIPIAVSQPAGHFFLEEDFELGLLKEGTCPFSRQSQAAVNDYGPL